MFLSLKEYIKLADKCYKQYTHKQASEDALSVVVEYMIRGDNKYRMGDKTRDSFRWNYGLFGIMASKRKKVKGLDFFHSDDTHLELDNLADIRYSLDDVIQCNELIANAEKLVDKRNLDIYLGHIMDGYSIKELSVMFSLSRTRIRAILDKTQKTLRERLNSNV